MSHLLSRLAATLLAAAVATPTLAAEVDRREANQQARIGEGVESGQLTPGETARLEKKEARIHRQVRRDRAENGGTLTPGEKAQVNREQNHASRDIYRAKHNGNHM